MGKVENRQRDVELVAFQLGVLNETVDLSIADVAPVYGGEQPETEEPGHEVGNEFASNAFVEGSVNVNQLVCLLLLKSMATLSSARPCA